jgi:large subunit ribosomal protein L22
MTVKAKLNNLRIAPRKVRLVADLIRGKKVEDALNQLDYLVKGAAEPMKKLLNQAVANAENNFKLKKEDLYVSSIIVDGGVTLKRWLPRSRGRADQLLKESSHITLELDVVKGEKKAKKAKAPVKKAAPKKTEKKEVKTETKKVEKEEVKKTEKK